jgi:5-methylcytosine-specific restriction protein A
MGRRPCSNASPPTSVRCSLILLGQRDRSGALLADGCCEGPHPRRRRLLVPSSPRPLGPRDGDRPQPELVGAGTPLVPMGKLRTCNEPGCPELVEGGRCPTHRRADQRIADAKRPSSYDRGYDRKWQRTAKTYLAKHRQCEWPGCSLLATDVDHRDGQGPLGPRGHDPSNLQALCHPHHSQKTATVDGGWGNEPMPGRLPPTLEPRGTTAAPKSC